MNNQLAKTKTFASEAHLFGTALLIGLLSLFSKNLPTPICIASFTLAAALILGAKFIKKSPIPKFCDMTLTSSRGILPSSIYALSLIGTSTLGACLIGGSKDLQNITFILLALGMYLVSCNQWKTLWGIIKENKGPVFVASYILWLGLANLANMQTSNAQIPYYLVISGISLALGTLIQNDNFKNVLLYSIITVVIASTLHRVLLEGILGPSIFIQYKNFAAVAAIYTLAMLLTEKYSKVNVVLAIITTITILVNPSTMGKITVLIIWAANLWFWLPSFIEKQNWKPTHKNYLIKMYKIIPIFFLIISPIAILKYQEKIGSISQLLNKSDNFNGRIDIWVTSLEWSKQSPIFGNGPNFWSERGAAAITNLGNSGQKDRGYNGLLDPLVQGGIPAILLLLTAITFSLKDTQMRFKNKTIFLLSLSLPLLTETIGIFGERAISGCILISVWLGFVWSHTKNLPRTSKK